MTNSAVGSQANEAALSVLTDGEAETGQLPPVSLTGGIGRSSVRENFRAGPNRRVRTSFSQSAQAIPESAPPDLSRPRSTLTVQSRR